MKSVTLSGARIKVYINDQPYNVAQGVQFVLDTGDSEIYGIDSPFPQEIGIGRSVCSGSIQGLRIGGQGGLQKDNIRPLLKNTLGAKYVRIRITDRRTGEDILFVPKAKVSNEQHQVPAKGRYQLSFSFRGIAGYQPLDRQ